MTVIAVTAEEVVLAAKNLVDAYIEAVEGIGVRRCGNIVVLQRWKRGGRQEVEKRNGVGIDPVCRNLIPREGVRR